jgi:hypothetical protein
MTITIAYNVVLLVLAGFGVGMYVGVLHAAESYESEEKLVASKKMFKFRLKLRVFWIFLLIAYLAALFF